MTFHYGNMKAELPRMSSNKIEIPYECKSKCLNMFLQAYSDKVLEPRTLRALERERMFSVEEVGRQRRECDSGLRD